MERCLWSIFRKNLVLNELIIELMDKDYFLVIDIGGTKIRSAIGDSRGHVLKKVKSFTQTRAGAKTIISDLFTMSDQVISLTGIDLSVLKGVGISFGGPVDFKKQKILRSQHVSGWDNLNLAKVFSVKYNLPAIIDNDANVAAFGEKVFGAGKKVDNLFYLTISTGIGGGVILDGKIWHGAHSLAGELGHCIIDRNGPQCSCGKKGCLEAMASGTGLARNVITELKNNSKLKTKIRRLVSNKLNQVTAITIYQAARQEDAYAKKIVDQSIANLALGISNAINIFDPQLIVIGGGITNEGEMFFEPLKKYVSEFSMFKKAFPVQIVPARLGDDAGLKGALALISQSISSL